LYGGLYGIFLFTVVGFGKAVGGMAKAVIDTIDRANVIEGIISVPTGSCYHLQHDLSPVRSG